MNDLHFLRPYILYLFIPFVFLFVLILLRNRKSKIWEQICSKDLVPYIIEKKVKRHFFFYLTFFSTISLLIIALAGPTWNSISVPLIKSQSGLVIALDLSNAMNAEDVKPSRLQRAIYKINDILNLRQEGQTALIVFSGDAFLVTPLTDDVDTIKALLPALETKIMPVSGHKVHRAIMKASELLTQAGIVDGSIMVITTELAKKDLEKSVQAANLSNNKVFVLGIGTEEGAPIPKLSGGFLADEKGALILSVLAKANLQKLAKQTNGTYMTMTKDDSDIHHFQSLLVPDNTVDAQGESATVQKKWHDQGYLLVLMALPFFVLVFRRGILVIAIFLMPHTVQAGVWDDIWQTRDQQGKQLFDQSDYHQASDVFENSDWKAASSYKSDNFEAAAELYDQNKSAEGLYNYGTAKAKKGDFEEALQAYQSALELQPDHEDAKFNKKLIEDHQKQQEDQQDNQDKNRDKDKNKNKNKDKDQSNKDKDKQDKENDKNDEGDQDQEPDQGDDKDKDQQDSEEDQEQDKQESEENDSQQDSDDKNQSSKKPQEPCENPNEQEQEEFKEKIEKEMQENKDQKEDAAEITQSADEAPTDPQRKADDRWLQRVKDDPGALLRRKFQLQYRNNRNSSNGEDE